MRSSWASRVQLGGTSCAMTTAVTHSCGRLLGPAVAPLRPAVRMLPGASLESSPGPPPTPHVIPPCPRRLAPYRPIPWLYMPEILPVEILGVAQVRGVHRGCAWGWAARLQGLVCCIRLLLLGPPA